MKLMSLIFAIVLLSLYCMAQDIPTENDPVLHPYLVNPKRVSMLNGKSISIYLNSPAIDPYAKLFYNGKFAVGDNCITTAICDSLLSANEQSRQFYLYVFCRIVELSDGALAEISAGYCLKYLRKYPCEALKLMKVKEYEFPLKQWTSMVSWTLYNDQYFLEFEKQLDPIIQQSCKSCRADWIKIKADIRAGLR